MISIKAIFIFLVASNLAALLVISYNYYTFRSLNGTPSGSHQSSVSLLADPPKFLFDTSYKFEDPILAAKILKKLDEFYPIGSSNYLKNDKGVAAHKFNQPFFGLISNDKYCEKHREYFTKNANDIFQTMNFVTDADSNSLLRTKVLSSIGQDLQPNVGSHMPKNEKTAFIHNIRPETHVFYTGSNMYEHKNLGQQFSCFSQASNHIPGHSILNTEEGLYNAMNKYGKKFSNKLECFNFEKFKAVKWDLSIKKECEDFFKKLSATKDDSYISFIRRTSVDSEGNESFQPINDSEENKLKATFDNGKLCGSGKVSGNYMIQRFINNPLLVNGHKFDTRVYMLIASTYPFIAYYHDGYARVSPYIYDSSVSEKTSLLASLNEQVQDNGFANGLTATELENSERWSFNKLQSYLVEKDIIKSSEDFDTKLRLQFKRAMVHVLRATTSSLVEKNNVYELFAMDFMLDEQFNLYLLDSTSNNLFTHGTEEDDKSSAKMLKDHFEIIFGLIRSRVKRGINYVNRLIQEKNVKESETGDIEISNEQQKRLEFLELTKNYFEPEYEPTKTNGFSKIMDANYYSFQRYNWLVERDCLF